MRALGRRVAAVGRVLIAAPDPTFLAYARAVVAYGGGELGSEGFRQAAMELARWLASGRRSDPCGPG